MVTQKPKPLGHRWRPSRPFRHIGSKRHHHRPPPLPTRSPLTSPRKNIESHQNPLRHRRGVVFGRSGREYGMTTRWPDLFIVGAPKCGTTAMTRYLEEHPIHGPTQGLAFFGTDLQFQHRTRTSEEAYLAHFTAAVATNYGRIERLVFVLAGSRGRNLRPKPPCQDFGHVAPPR